MKYPRTRSSALKLGRTYYKTGNPCSRGHVSIRFTKNGRCKECDLEDTTSRYNLLKARTPGWANIKEINEIYKKSSELGKDFHVDHIIPLRGKFVSGLHVHTNLEIKHRLGNLKKGNLFEIC